MLNVARFLTRKYKFHPIGKKLESISSFTARRQYWGFSKHDDDVHSLEGDDSSKNSSSKSLVSPYGENSPSPNPILILPTSRPIIPGFLSAVTMKDEATIEALSNSRGNLSTYLGIFLRNGPSPSTPDLITDLKDIYSVGTFAQVQNIVRTEIGTQLVVMGHRRIRLEGVESYGPPTIARVQHLKRPRGHETVTNDRVKAYMNEIVASIRELMKINPLLQEQFQLSTWLGRIDFNDPYRLADFASTLTAAEAKDLQLILETENIENRLALVLELLAKDKEVAKLQREINKQVEEKMSKQQRDYFLREQLKSIKKELGMEKDDKDELVSKYMMQLNKLLELNDKHQQNKEKMGKSEVNSGTEIDDKVPASNNPQHQQDNNNNNNTNTNTNTSAQQQHLHHPHNTTIVSSAVIEVMQEEIKKLENLEKNSPEFNVTRTYLDWLFHVPWSELSQDTLIIKSAKTILDEDHYGLEEVKKRILEFIAVGKLRGSVNGKIICLIGPPGVGKTSIAKSIARALNKHFYRFSVGGLTDTAEIKGHRRTYIGAMPGKPIQCLKNAGTMNPLILIDEIDKLGRSYNGDPASALLELLDPNQNSSFIDHFLDVPVDFSQVLFVCTANDESTIPGPLIDRMEVIRLSGYDIQEKIAIADRYLVPKAFKEAGLLHEKKAENGIINKDILEMLIKNYCRESGIRSLEKIIEKIARKIVYKKVITEEEAVETKDKEKDKQETEVDNNLMITKANIEEFVGKPIFTEDTIYGEKATLPAGIVMGLAWNPLGGSPIYIETTATASAVSERDSGPHMVTGQLGSVMKESVQIAYTFARKFVASEIDTNNKFFQSHQVHLHVPEGAVSKDGPSAGVAMTTSFISLAINKPVKEHTAMTGELSLTGKVLPVGGIKEKTLAAKRSGARTILLPFANKRDYDELPDYVKQDLEVHFVKSYEEVYKILF